MRSIGAPFKRKHTGIRFAATAICVAVLVCLCAFGASGQSRESRVVIESSEWKIVGDLVVPRSKTPVPAVVLLNKANGSRKAYESLARHLAAYKIASIRIDLRAHGDSINRGRFVPFRENAANILNDSDKDILAATQYIKKISGIDKTRIGFVGASYSGEEMAISARKNGYGKVYVALSPGSFSDESIDAIDGSNASWLFVRSADERSMKNFFEKLRQRSKTAHTLEIPGTKHATDLLESNPELPEMIAVWLKYRL